VQRRYFGKIRFSFQELALYKKLSIFLLSDSQIVLAWLNKYSSHWKTFVANRVSLIETELMGDLSAWSVTASRPFITSGLDCAGPFQVRSNKGRGHRSFKAYVVLFVCFITRALHFEVVIELRTNAFITAFRRFTSRRGLCRRIYSDNATTSKAGDSELRGMFKVNIL
jgi:hypothetical protein